MSESQQRHFEFITEQNMRLIDQLRRIGIAIKGGTDIPIDCVESFERLREQDAARGKPWPGDG